MVTGLSTSSEGSAPASEATSSAEATEPAEAAEAAPDGTPAAAAAHASRNTELTVRTDEAAGAAPPRDTDKETAVIVSITCSSPTTAGHHAEARRLIDGGSDIVRWNSARRSATAR